MILRHQRMLLFGMALTLIGLLASGCATKSFVMKETQAVEEKTKANKARIDQLDQKISDTDAKAEQALSEARKALRKAEEAAGYVNYRVIGERNINFDFDKYDLTKVSKDILDEMGASMQGNPAVILEIEGHTDNVASDAYNLALGQNRAQSVKRYLADRFGIALHRIFYISHGESKPIELNDSRTGRAANRRAVLRLLGPPSQ
jgi:outer membrane protein OmpA-like peptidoglycan-associated protein